MNYKAKKQAGFTVIELIIVISLSAGVFGLAAGIFVQSIKMQRQAFFIQEVQENVSFALESMAKEIRVSTANTSNTSCPASPTQALSVTHPVNGDIDYFLSAGDIHRRLPGSGIDTVLNSTGTEITRLDFCITGNGAGDNSQPRVTILLTVTNGMASPNDISFDIQTTVSQRLLSD